MTMRVVVGGLIASNPAGGVVWDYGQYLLGLMQLGCEVVYLEDTGLDSYDEQGRSFSDAPDGAVRYLADALAALSPALADRWHLRTPDARTFGMSPQELDDAIRSAELFVNVSGGTLLREAYADVPRTLLIDTDPGFNHFRNWPRADRLGPEEGVLSWRAHTHHATYAELIGQPGCALPDLDVPWLLTRPPVCLDRWSPSPPGDRWTTVMTWGFYGGEAIRDPHGRRYGGKEAVFHLVEDLPSAVPSARFEIASKPTAPVEAWRSKGWSWSDTTVVARSPQDYRSFVQTSRAEVSVAKQIYVETVSGWSSCRSACYLAAGRPVVLQDTGWSRVVSEGHGLLAFSTPQEAADGVRAVQDDLAGHSDAARAVAETDFAAAKVLERLLQEVGA